VEDDSGGGVGSAEALTGVAETVAASIGVDEIIGVTVGLGLTTAHPTRAAPTIVAAHLERPLKESAATAHRSNPSTVVPRRPRTPRQ